MGYVGQLAELAGGVGTLTSDNNSARARAIDLIVAEGVISRRGVWEREEGAAPYMNTPLGSATPTLSFSARTTGAAAVFATYKLTGTFNYEGLNGTEAGLTGIRNYIVTGATGFESGSAVVIAMTRSSLTGFSGITDDAGNAYVKAGSVTFDTCVVELWVALNIAALATGQRIIIDSGATNAIWVTSVHTFNGLRALDQVLTATGGPGTTQLVCPTFTQAEQDEAVIIAYGDTDNASGVTGTPTSVHGSGTISFGVGSEVFQSVLPLVQPGVNALVDYWITTTTQRLLALASDGKVYKSSGGDFTALTMATQMTDQAGSLIIVGGQETAGAARKAFFLDGVTKIQTLTGDGVATTNFGNNWNTTTNIPVDWTTNPPRGAVIHKERLWPWAPANAPHNIYASKLRDHENFKNAVGGSLEYVQEIGTGTGIRISAGVSFKGMLFIGKFPRGIFFLDDTDVDYLNWRWNLVSDAVGPADSPYAMLALDDDVLIVDPAGHMHFLSAITTQGVRTSDLTAALNLQQWTRDNINLARLDRMTSVWYPAEKVAILGFSSVGSTSNDLRMFLDFSNADPAAGASSVRISYSHRDVTRALAVRRDSTVDGVQRPIFAEDDGTVWKWTPDSKTKVGVPNAGQARYQYNPTNFDWVDPSLANKRKIFDALTITFNPVGSWNLSVDSIIDGNYHETLHFSMGGAASVLGTFRFGDRLGGGSIATLRHRMTGHGYWLSLAGWVQGDGHDFSVATHLVNFRVGGEEQR